MATLWRRDINLHFTGEEMEFDSSQTSEHILQVACFLFDPQVHSLFPLPASSHWKLKSLSCVSVVCLMAGDLITVGEKGQQNRQTKKKCTVIL